MDINKIKVLRRRRRRRPKTQLNTLWRLKKDELSIKDLLYIVRLIYYIRLQERAIKEFLKRPGLSFDDFYHMLDASRDILKQNPKLKGRFWGDFLDLCDADSLLELAEIGEERAAKELFRKIEKGIISSAKAKLVLIRLFEKQTKNKMRKVLWEKIKDLNPSETDLKYLLNLPGMYALHKIRNQMEKFLGQLTKEQKPGRTLKALASLATKLETKKESS